uniref:Gloverin (Fragments) n=1 Tax=Heliothis virescens TaxID=7102 RepID=GLOV_HELVI|nr:RecName: Full=Gloverin [Heliothis virescens]
VFGTLGSTDDSLFGRYKQDIFNDHRGHLQGQAYGSR